MNILYDSWHEVWRVWSVCCVAGNTMAFYVVCCCITSCMWQAASCKLYAGNGIRLLNVASPWCVLVCVTNLHLAWKFELKQHVISLRGKLIPMPATATAAATDIASSSRDSVLSPNNCRIRHLQLEPSERLTWPSIPHCRTTAFDISWQFWKDGVGKGYVCVGTGKGRPWEFVGWV